MGNLARVWGHGWGAVHVPRAPDIFPGGNKTAMSYFQVPLSQRLSWANSRDIISTCEIESTRQQNLSSAWIKLLRGKQGWHLEPRRPGADRTSLWNPEDRGYFHVQGWWKQTQELDKLCFSRGFPGISAGKESTCNAGDPGLIPGSGRSAGEGNGYPLQYSWASLVAQLVKNLPTVRETWVWSLAWEDLLEKGMATHSSFLAWRVSWTVWSRVA